MLARYILSSCVRLSVRHKPALYRNGCRLIDFVIGMKVISIYPTLCYKEIWVPLPAPKIRVLPSGTLPQSLGLKILPWQVDRVVNKIHRRLSLLTTPIRQSTSCGCLLNIGRL